MIDWIALVWLGASFSVLGIAAVGVFDSFADLKALDGAANGRRLFYRALLFLQFGLLLIGIGWTYLGLLTAFDARIVPLNNTTAILIASNVLLAIISGVFLFVRRRLLA